ncbi:MAG: hypothetical protein R3F58_03235 [Steroidobacteraceae bacterium]
MPFTGDQHFFTYGARILADGGRLYVDFWDIKQPGIFWVYRLALSLPFDIVPSVRSIETLSWTAVAALSVRIVRTQTGDKWIAALAPAFAAGVPLAVAPAWHLSQVESFAILPITVVVYLLVNPRLTRLRCFGVGVAAGVLGVLKLLLVLIPASIFLCALLLNRSRRANFAQTNDKLIHALVYAAAGFMSLAAVVCLILALDGTLAAFLDATFYYPFTIIRDSAAVPASRLFLSLGWAAWTSIPTLLVTPLAVSRSMRIDLQEPVILLIVWVCAALLALLMQRTSWWAYHTMLLKTPIAILALIGASRIDRATPFLVQGRTATTACVALFVFVLSVSTSGQTYNKLGFLSTRGAGTNVAQTYEEALVPGYPELRNEATRLRATFATSLCVLGDPALLVFSGLKCTSSVWAGAALNDDMWSRLLLELRRSPPELIYVAASEVQMIEVNAPDLLPWIAENYDFMRNGQGTDRVFHLRQQAAWNAR